MEIKNNILLTKDQESIIALCTPRGSGAIAMLRLSGQDSFSVADKFAKLSSGKSLESLQTHTIHHGHIIDFQDSSVIDEVLFFLMRAPKTFTGQDTVEISCHNNQFIIQKIIEIAIKSGARLAVGGEFTQRAFLNGKIDLIQAEAINDIITAQTELALKKSMAQLQGSFSFYLNEIEDDLIKLLSLVEASFEFLDEEQQDINLLELINLKFEDLLKKLDQIKINFNQQQCIRNGIKISLIGSTNSGKSTLFNAILKKDRAIVSGIAGTTRDSIESSIYKDGNFWLMTDTAGLRETSDLIEKEGIDRSWQQAEVSDIILLVLDISQDLSNDEIEVYNNILNKHKDKIIIVANKVDLHNKKVLEKLAIDSNKNKIIFVSALEKKGIDELEVFIEEKIKELFCLSNSPFLLNQRQYGLIIKLEQNLKFLVNQLSFKIDYELIAYHLKEMLENLAELTGRNVSEKVLDRVFKDFCIGK